METTLELSMDKWPPISQMEHFWATNRDSMLAYIDAGSTTTNCLQSFPYHRIDPEPLPHATTDHGTRGTVKDAATQLPLDANITVAKMGGAAEAPRSFAVRTSPQSGWYFRILTPGPWRLFVSSNGYVPQERTVTVPNGTFVVAHFDLMSVPSPPMRTNPTSPTTPASLTNPTTTFQPLAPFSSGENVRVSDAEPYSVMLFFSAVLPAGILIYLRFRR